MEIGAGEWSADPHEVQAKVARFAAALPDARVIIKPSRLGSSVGIAIVHHPDDPEYAGAAIVDALNYDDAVLVEAYLDHPRELEMSVVGNSAHDLETFGPGEIFPGREFYDYVAKYVDGVSRTTDSPEIPVHVRERLHAISRDAFLAIGASGFSRVDFMVDRHSTGTSSSRATPSTSTRSTRSRASRRSASSRCCAAPAATSSPTSASASWSSPWRVTRAGRGAC
jgi:D-alanine-D-alanine ligase-like ATP-grasp enzyme